MADRTAESAKTGNSEAIAAAFADGPAYIPYLAVGDPDYESSKAYVEALDRGGADIIELGLPFSGADRGGSTIQGALVRALDAGMTPDRFFAFAEEVDVEAPLVCMTYYNLIYQYGGEARSASDASGETASAGPRPFVERAAAAGIEGLVVPDLPAEEADPCERRATSSGSTWSSSSRPPRSTTGSIGSWTGCPATSTCRRASGPPARAATCPTRPRRA